MRLDDFELEIEPKIIKRGEAYFAEGLVDELWNPDSGHYCAVVDGSEPYEVEIWLDSKGEIVDHVCDCPYDWGEYCKHEVAVLLAVQEHQDRETAALPRHRKKKKRGLAALLQTHTKAELIEMVVSLSRQYNLRDEIECYFEHDLEELDQ